jgi:hypothetical protein
MFTVEVLIIPFSTLSEPEEIMKFYSEFIVSIISIASPVNIDPILAILNFQVYHTFRGNFLQFHGLVF